MLGVPTETEEDLELTAALMREINPEIHAPSYYSPIPGSDLHDYCRDLSPEEPLAQAEAAGLAVGPLARARPIILASSTRYS